METTTKQIPVQRKSSRGRYPGYRTMTGAQRYNARHDQIWAEAKVNLAKYAQGVVAPPA